jgi:molybdenum cofactor guanylyltransferase
MHAVYDQAMGAESPKVAAFMLAGGNSRRMGADKAFVEMEGRTLLARMLEQARSVTEDVWIVGSKRKFSQFAPVIEDIFPDCGPLAGIHSALCGSSAELNLMLAIDMPFVSPDLLCYVVRRAARSAAAATVPRVEGRWQPLCAVYRREFVGAAEQNLRAGHYKIDALFSLVEVQPIEQEELEAAGFSADMFQNLNTPEELLAAQKVNN